LSVPTKSKRRRELARRNYERWASRRAEQAAKRARRRRVAMAITLTVTLVALVAGGVWWLGILDDDDDPAALPDSNQTLPSSCTYTDSPGENEKDLGRPPTTPIGLDRMWTASLSLNGQPVTAQLDPSLAWCTVTALQFLADNSFYDATTCHRLTTSDTLKVLQCGDPTGTGMGGPGFRMETEGLSSATTYPVGTIAMANAGEGPTTGSQFFIVWGESPGLAPNYTVVGHVTSGMEHVQAIAAGGVTGGGQDGAPAQPVTLDDLSVTVA
jgi:peptidyl-prolyl cis-trans isomerase B (cyclophilin B)